MPRPNSWIVLCVLCVCCWHAKCTQGSCTGEYESLSEWPSSGYIIHFVAVEDHAHVWVNSPDGISSVSTFLQNTETSLGLVGGPTENDNTFNPGYSYRLQPDTVSFSDFWIEVCDATPCYVEDNWSDWEESPNTWCPWSFQALQIWDCSSPHTGDCTSVWTSDDLESDNSTIRSVTFSITIWLTAFIVVLLN